VAETRVEEERERRGKVGLGGLIIGDEMERERFVKCTCCR
jgi:hypothetical protein